MKCLALALFLLPGMAAAQSASCPPPAELAGWSAMAPVAAGRDAAGAAMLTVGAAVKAALPFERDSAVVVAPGKPGAADAHAGLLAFTVAKAGRYRVAMGAAAWIEVVAGGTALSSVAHGHGPDCSGVRKMVDFDLKPGTYLLQITGAREATIGVMVARLG